MLKINEAQNLFGGLDKIMEQSLRIRVNIEEAIERLQNMIDDEFVTAELTFVGGRFEEDCMIKLSAVDSIDDNTIEYCEIYYDNGEL